MASSSRGFVALPLEEPEVHCASVVKHHGGWANGRTKRGLDVVLALSACVLAAPALGILAAAIKTSSPGPVLFRQTRMGRCGQPFTILKFRTMRVQDGPLVTARNDSRITPVGRLLRRFKLDELPQLFNVLTGDMSFVGPRPKIFEHEAAPLLCRPGLTGAATLAFIEEEKMLVDIPEDKLEAYAVQVLHQIKSDVDREYALHSNLWTDLSLLGSTALHLVRVRRSSRVEEMNHRILEAQLNIAMGHEMRVHAIIHPTQSSRGDRAA